MAALRYPNRLSLRAIGLFVVCLMILAACGSGEGGDDESTAGGDDDEPTVEEDDDEPTVEEDDSNGTSEPRSGGRLVVGSFGEANSTDPILMASAGLIDSGPGLALYDSLIRLDPDGNWFPFVAESMESDDLVTWTMTLRPDVRFHDGTPLDAEAVVFNTERHLDPDNNSPGLPLLENVESVEATDDLTVVFELHSPFTAFPNVFADQPGWIASPAAIEEHGDDYPSHPAGVGPFKFVSWVVDGEMQLERNDDYWQEGLPYLDEVILRPIGDSTTRLSSVRSGDVDFAPSIVGSDMETAREDPELEVIQRVGNGGQGIVINMEADVVDDVRVRRALGHAINRDAIDNALFGGTMPRAQGPFAPDSQWAVQSTLDMFPEEDLEAAAALMEEYHAEVGRDRSTLEIMCSATPDRATLAELVQQMLEPIGIDVEIDLLDVTELVSRLRDTDFQIGCHTINSFVDPVPNLERQFRAEAQRNYSNWQNSVAEEAFIEGRRTGDLEERQRAYDIVNQELAKDMPYFLYSNALQGVTKRSDVHMDEYNGELWYYFGAVWIDR